MQVHASALNQKQPPSIHLPRHVLSCKQTACRTSQKRISCETPFKFWQWKMWKRSFRARQTSKCESGRCENWAFVRGIAQKLTVKDVKTELSFKTPSKNWKLLWDLFAVRSLCCKTTLQWDLFAVRLLCYEVSLLKDPFAVRLLCSEISLLWDLFAVRSLCWKIPLL